MKPAFPLCLLAIGAMTAAEDLKIPRGRNFNGDLASTKLLLDWDRNEYTLRHGKGIDKVACTVTGTIRKRRYSKPVEAKAHRS